MVNVNKDIVPGKKAGVQSTTKQRRPRNTELNSSKSATSAITGVNLANIRKLNCSRESVLQELRRWLSEEEAKDYLEAFENETGTQVVRLASPEEAALDGDFWAVKDGKEQLWYRTDGEWYTKDDLDGACGKTDTDSSLNCESGSAKVSGTVTIYNDFADLDNDTTERLLRSRIEKAVPGAKVDFEKVNDTDVKVMIDCPDVDAEKARLAVESSDVTKSVDWESSTKEFDSAKDVDKTSEGTTLNSSAEPEGDTDGGDSVSEGVDLSDIKITTESGNEVSMEDIKIVQNPDTNELAIFIPEDEEETIPEGFSVIGMVVPDMVGSVPAIECSDVCPECGQDPCVCESTDGGEELDSSKKKNELTEGAVNSALGGGDDRQDATSQVTVPKNFPDDKIYDLYRWVETELLHEGIDVDVYGVGRPSANTISFEFEVTGRDPAEVDAIIEDRVKEFIANGNNAIQYPKGDPRSELNSDTQGKNLNCTVDNARVEQTEQGTWVVRADTDRFGKDAILYEHYSEEGANKYLDRLKAGGDAVAAGYDGSTDDINMRYKEYLITGNDKTRYVCVSPYGKYSPKSYATVDEAKAAVDEDIKTSSAKK